MNNREDTIRHLAYALWEARGRLPDSADVDWLAAEHEVTGHTDNARDQDMQPAALVPAAPLGSNESTNSDADGVVNPKDGRGPLRASDDQSDKLPVDLRSVK